MIETAHKLLDKPMSRWKFLYTVGEVMRTMMMRQDLFMLDGVISEELQDIKKEMGIGDSKF